MILLAAALGLASRAGAEGARSSDAPQQPPPSDRSDQTGNKTNAQKARELGQRGTDAVRRGASAAGKKVNEGGQAATAKVVGTQTVSGRISGVSPERVTVKPSEGAAVELRLTESTQVTVGGQKGSVGALHEGDDVRASFARSGGSATAMKIEVKRSPRPASRAGAKDGRPGSSAAPAPGATTR
jgi:hypothetical protein